MITSDTGLKDRIDRADDGDHHDEDSEDGSNNDGGNSNDDDNRDDDEEDEEDEGEDLWKPMSQSNCPWTVSTGQRMCR